jgi:ABC-2 type transport system ATP-binding protein
VDNLRHYWSATGRPAPQARFDEALGIAGLGSAAHRRVRTYSQGMRQRLAIAQAMLGLPDLLVLDEPANGLDPPQIHQLREVLRRYAATGRSVLLSSHLLSEVEQTCSHVAVLHRGKLVTAGTVEDIVSGNEATFLVDEPEQAAATLRSLEGLGEVRVEGNLVHADLAAHSTAVAVNALVASGVAVSQVGPRRRLEDAFLHLVDGDSTLLHPDPQPDDTARTIEKEGTGL